MNPLNPVCALVAACGPKYGEPASPAEVQYPENSLNGSIR